MKTATTFVAMLTAGLLIGLTGFGPAEKAWAQKRSGGKTVTASAGSDLEGRLAQVEGQLVEIRVILDTLESLARSGGTSGGANFGPTTGPGTSGAGGSGAATARITALETQIRALSLQVEQLTREVRAASSSAQGNTPDGTRAGGDWHTEQNSQRGPIETGRNGGQDWSRFGTTTVRPGRDGAGDGRSANQFSQTETFGAGSSPTELYNRGFTQINQQDMKAAETTFKTFLERYPNDQLTPNAKYWLGEIHFQRRDYRKALPIFYDITKRHRTAEKAPNSLLKIALIFDKVGQKDDACNALKRLSSRSSNAPVDIRARAMAESRRLGCR